MKRFIPILIFSLLVTVAPVSAKTLSKVAAVVNDEIITTYQLDKAVVAALAKKSNSNQLTATQFDQMKIQVLKKMVNDKLLKQRIVELDLHVSAAEIDNAVEDVQRKNGLTREELEQALVSQGMSMAKYMQQIKDEILRYRLLGREVNYKVMVTSREVRSYYDQHIDEYDTTPKIRINRISFDIPAGNEDEQLAFRKRVNVSRYLLLDGEGFEKVLATQEDSVSGDDMGLLVEADLAEPILLALVGLVSGDVSEPVEIGGQLHLFQITERTSIAGDPFDQYKAEIEEKLKREKTDIRFDEWQLELSDKAFIEIRI